MFPFGHFESVVDQASCSTATGDIIAARQRTNGGHGTLRTRLTMKFVCIALIAWAAVSGAYSQSADGQAPVIWIAMEGRTQLKKTAPGTTLEGKLARSVYWRGTEVFPKGSTVRLVVDQIESRKKSYAVDDRPFVIRLFAPRHDVVARFRSVNVLMPGGGQVPLRATFIALTQRAELRAETEKPAAKGGKAADASGPAPKSKQQEPVPPWVLTLQVEPEGTTFPALAEARAGKDAGAPAACPEPCTIADGTRMSLVLLEGLSAAKNHQGQTFQAVLLEPVRVGATIAIPQGSILQGVLAKRVPPRRLYRPGSLNLLFTHLSLPNGAATAIAASPVAAEVDRGTHMTMDSEGRIHAQNPGKARFLLDFAVTGGISKVSDDTTQLIIEAISSTATDASTAGVARFAAMGATGIFLLTRHGRDVILPPYTEMDVSLSRAVSLGSDSPATASAK
jgi:hypothetical protein